MRPVQNGDGGAESSEKKSDVAAGTDAGVATSIDMLSQVDALALDLLLKTAPAAADKFDPQWAAAYLEAIAIHLQKHFPADRYVDPVRRIVKHLSTSAGTDVSNEGIEGIYAVAAAEISYLILSGLSEQDAVRKITRTLIAEGHDLPRTGGDSRGWMRLSLWRDRLRERKTPEHLHAIYKAHLAHLRVR
jgi:hypothetical protein